MAHALSISYPKPNSIKMLNGARFPFDSNQIYRMPSEKWKKVKRNPTAIQDILQWFIKDHYTTQLPRILTLERYYQGDNDIKFWKSDKQAKRADNRVTSGLPRYITNIRVGYQFGNPIKFGYANPDNEADTGDDMTDTIDRFDSQADETYHEKVMGKNLNNTGRAYELIYAKEGTNELSLKAIDPANAFIVYDTTIEQHSLFGVRYYMNKYMDQITYYVEVYTDSSVFYYTSTDSPFGPYTFVSQDEHFFESVPLTEYELNDERLGSWEPKLDEIDVYDKSLSEMANSQEDFNNAILVISGDVDPDDDDPEPLLNSEGEQMYDSEHNKLYKVHRVDPTQNLMFLRPSQIEGTNGTVVIPTDAKYLTKALDPSGWDIYVKRLLSDIHKDTNTPDVTDENFAANASGVAMSYKLWGSDQERAIQESLYKRGLMRRLRLMANYWSFISEIHNPELIENIQITFTPNLPKNDSEIVTNMQALNSTGKFSGETMHELAEPITGVPADQEQQRLDDDRQNDIKQGLRIYNTDYATDQQKGGVVDGSNSGTTTDNPINSAR